MEIYTSSAVAQASSAVSAVWMPMFFAILVFFLFYSVILVYHWFTYSMHARAAIMATTAYFILSAVLLFSMLSSAVTLSLL